MAIPFSRWLTAAIGLVCGAGLYIVLVNRVLSRLRDGLVKTAFLTLAFTFFLGGFSLFGYASGFSAWSLILVLVLLGLALGEARYRRYRRLHQADLPISRTGRPFSILRPMTAQDLQIINYTASLPGWRGPPLRIAHLSDLHVHEHSSMDYFRSVMEQVNHSQPDLIFVTGDFAADLKGIDMLPEMLQTLRSRLGSFAILGNHDYWTDAARVREVVSQAGLDLLDSRCPHMLRDGLNQLALVGCEAPWGRDSCTAFDVQENIPVLALSHTADLIYALSRAGVAAVFSGHYHAGQMQLPGFGPLIVPSVYGRRFFHGHYRVGQTHLFVTAGVGESHPPLRIYCPPDILLVDLLEN